MKTSVLTMLVVLCMWDGVAGQHIIMNSDTDKVMLCVDLLRTSIQQGNLSHILTITGDELTVGDAVLDSSSYVALIDSAFRTAGERGAAEARPLEITAAGFWDFSLEDPETELRNDSCFVTCRLRLYASRTTDGRAHEANETLVFVKHGKGWRLEKIHHLFDFLTGGQ